MRNGWDIEEEDCDEQREDDGGKEVEVLRGFVEGGRMLKDGQAAGMDGHEIEPLPVHWDGQ